MKEPIYENQCPPDEPITSIFQDIQDNQWHVQIIDTSGNVAIIQEEEIGGVIRDLTKAQRRMTVYSKKLQRMKAKTEKKEGKG